jgi:hypothetical protein
MAGFISIVGINSTQAQLRSAEQPPDIDKIIQQFAAKESAFQEARNYYTFRQEVRIQTIGFSNQPTGEFYRVSDVLFDDSGKRTEKIVRFPQPTLRELQITPNDLRDLSDVQPFSLTTKELPKYLISYVGKEKIDEIDAYVFDVKPKVIPKYKRDGGERVFAGRIWVDDRDMMIVKTFGKGLPQGEEQFPKFETYRENIDGKFWFPTYTFADDNLEFKNGSIHMRMEVRYTNYKRFSSDVKIELGDEEPEEEQKKPNKK